VGSVKEERNKRKKLKVAVNMSQTNEAMQEAMEHLVLHRESQSSVDITQDAKGSIKVTVKAYADDPDVAAQKAMDTFDRVRRKYKLT
jgi:spore germination protein YaaH